MQHEGLSSSKFAEAIGIQRAAMSHIISDRNNPSLDVLMKILQTFTYIDSDWLMFGKGNMMRTSVKSSTEPDLFSNMPTIPTNVPPPSEYRKEKEVNTPVNIRKHPDTEPIIVKNIISKKVDKVVVFYSDDTFETFIPEKSKKE